MTAQEAAGVIHSDFVSKFIPAEVGKNYVVRDGDIMKIRHS